MAEGHIVPWTNSGGDRCCCEGGTIGCPESTCISTHGDGNTPATCPVSRVQALLLKQGGSWTLSAQAEIDAQFESIFGDKYKTVISASGSNSYESENKCYHSFPLFSISSPDYGGIFDSDGTLLVPSPDGIMSCSASLSISETASDPKSFCISLWLVSRSITGTYHNLNVGFIDAIVAGGAALSFGSCENSFDSVIVPKAPWPSVGTDLSGTGSFTAELSLSATPP